jgi:phosphatidylglycerol:prolipoprotein diacylglycerol transferase
MYGILVATGILVGARLTQNRGVELGLDKEQVASMITTSLICGFLFAHIFDVLAYQTKGPSPTFWQILNPFGGLSSFGGFIGALGGLFYWCWRKKQKVMPYADSLAFGLAAGWTFGRLGCFSAHDHPGRLTHFFLSVQYPVVGGGPVHEYLGGLIGIAHYPTGARHDLGLDEALFALAMTIVFLVLKKRGKQPLGLYLGLLTVFYAPVRFALDFLRTTELPGADPRYFGLTPAQYGSIAVLVAGVSVFVWMRRHRMDARPCVG